jgi:hypothetical protein
MKYIITLSVLVMSFSLATAQFRYDSVSLVAQDKPLPIKRVPFDKVVVFDNRFDTVCLRVDESQRQSIKMDCFSQPASEEIKNFIENSIVFFPEDKGTVYISIKQLRIGNLGYLSHKLFFAADAYLSKNEKLEKIYSVKKEYSFGHSYKNAITKALNKFIVELCNDYYKPREIDSNAYTVNDVNNNVINDWASYRIIKENQSANGVFKSFDDFRNNIMDSCVDFSLQISADSTYHIVFSGKNDYYDANTRAVKNIFAVSFNNELYIPILGQHFMPLYKTNNSFEFYVPASLPDPYTIIYNQRFTNDEVSEALDLTGIYVNSRSQSSHSGHGHHTGNGASDWKAALIVTGALVGIAATIAIVNAVKRKHHQQDQRMQIEALRYCFLDMDTGDFIYY